MQLRQPLQEGETIQITFIFGETGEITVTAPVASLAARTPPQ
jgi:copper(I)-binding protein